MADADHGVRLRTDIVSAVVLSEIDGHTKMLLLKRAGEGYWCHVGGKVEAGETAVEAVRRELGEEIGVEPKALYNADYIAPFYKADHDEIFVVTCFVAVCLPDQPVVLNAEHTDYRWCARSEAIARVPFPNQKALFEHVWRWFVACPPPSELLIG